MLFGCEGDGEGTAEGFGDLIGEGGMFQSQCICENINSSQACAR